MTAKPEKTPDEHPLDDLRIRPQILLDQVKIARQAGFDRLASNLARAAELTQVPNEELLKMYESLRPGRSTYDQLIQLADYLEKEYSASLTAQFVREAAEAYRMRSLLLPG